jgi:hypothetical protein
MLLTILHLLFGLVATAVIPMASVPVMHEDVHQRARRQEQPREIGDEVCAMLGHDEETADDGEHGERQLHPPVDDVLSRGSLVVHACFPVAMDKASIAARLGFTAPPCD